jgi:pyruvate/2-oxoglutarate dehydrogenase complex dihydrolipoamide dehydrogenase (E3) component
MLMTRYDYDMGVIGGGAAGLTVTAGSAQLGAKTLLIEKEKDLGGDCLHFGCVPSKTLIKSARVFHYMKNSETYGLPGVDLPPVDFNTVAGRIKDVIGTIQKHDSDERFCRLGAQVIHGTPEFINEHSVRISGKTLSAKNWVIATGSSPAVPPIRGLDQTPFLTNKEIFSQDRLPATMIILGAGPIALEMAQAFGRLGTRVMVVQRSGQILSREDRDMAEGVKGVLEQEGVVFYLDAAVDSVKGLGPEVEVGIRLKNGITASLTTEKILVAMGRAPNIEGLGLSAAGILIRPNGIVVDKRLRTTRKHIFAAGDVTGEYQFTHAAGYEGGVVVSNAVFHLPRKTDYTWFPWCTYTDPELAGIGMNEKTAKEAGIDYKIMTEEFTGNDRSLAEGETVGKLKLVLDKKEKIIGVQILGPHAGELINEWVAVLNGHVKLSTLASAVHPYPTLGEINKRIAGNYFSPKIFSDRVKKGLKFFFNLQGKACG